MYVSLFRGRGTVLPPMGGHFHQNARLRVVIYDPWPDPKYPKAHEEDYIYRIHTHQQYRFCNMFFVTRISLHNRAISLRDIQVIIHISS